jgi:Transcriptional Coactivator p15 (PC4)
MASRNPLPEPIVIDRFWKNRRRKDAVVIQLSSYEGHNLIDLRTHSMSSDGKLLPTKKGLAVSILRLPELAKAINKALARAVELGLIDGEASK